MQIPNPEQPKFDFRMIALGLLFFLSLGVVGFWGLSKYYMEKAKLRVPQDMDTAVGLAQGIQQFRQEYGRWPVVEGEKHQSDQTFIVNLLGYDTRVNKRGINFLADIRIAKGTPPVNGLHRTGDTGEIFDRWGNHFIIAIDHDRDGWVENPEGNSPTGHSRLHIPIAVVSPGRDGVVSGKNREGKDATKDNWRSW